MALWDNPFDFIHSLLSLSLKPFVLLLYGIVKIGDATQLILTYIKKISINAAQGIDRTIGSPQTLHVIDSLRQRIFTIFAALFIYGKLHPLRLPKIRNVSFISWKLRLPHLVLPNVRLPDWLSPIIIARKKNKKLKATKLLQIYPRARQISDRIRVFFLGVVITIIFIAMPLSATVWLKSLPNPNLLTKRAIEVTTKIFDRHGNLLYEMYADQNRTPIPLSDIPLVVKEATIAIEDRDFYLHPGFSLRGIARALYQTIANQNIQGGSTITQQLIKSALLNPEVKLTRKIKEIVLAFWAERLYTKDEILEMYFNQVPYGGTSWGIEAAAQTYFGSSVKNLSLAQAALLAGLPAAPTTYSPLGSQPQKAFVRQREVLRRMVEDRYISQKQADDAASEQIVFKNLITSIRAPHFVMYIRELLEKKYGTRLVERGGLRIVTSLDLPLQEVAATIVKNSIDKLLPLRVGNGAALVTNPRNGEILAMVGSKDYFNIQDEGNVNVTTSLRQPGSAIKVVTYALALENGFTPATVLDDSPVVYHAAGGPDYAPVNYDSRFHGLVPLRYALGNSYNIPAVKTLAKLGVRTMIEKGRSMGITSWADTSRYGLSLTLGGGELTMLEMGQVFGTLANGGMHEPLVSILEITDYTGRVIEKNTTPTGNQAVNPAVSWIMGNILSDNTARMSAFGPNSSLVIPGKTVSVKTGTSNDKRDNWTIGYTPSVVVAVWVGNNDNSPMHPTLTSGVTGAAPIWHDIMTEILKDSPDEASPKPESVVAFPCYFGRTEYFVQGTEPSSGRCAPLPTPSSTPTP